MPQPDSNFQTSIVIACEGPEEGCFVIVLQVFEGHATAQS